VESSSHVFACSLHSSAAYLLCLLLITLFCTYLNILHVCFSGTHKRSAYLCIKRKQSNPTWSKPLLSHNNPQTKDITLTCPHLPHCQIINLINFSFKILFLDASFFGNVLGDILWWSSFEWLERTFKGWMENSCCNSRTRGRCFSFYSRHNFTHVMSCGASTTAAVRTPASQGRLLAELSVQIERKVAKIWGGFDS
jgi:hypothetical protein